MKYSPMHLLRCTRGFTILELLIAAFITGIITTASMQFYASLHNQSSIQAELSEAQSICRASLHDIKRNLRQAGYKLSGHPAYKIQGDSLSIYLSQTQPVDTILYFLSEISESEYNQLPNFPSAKKVYRLMKQTNANPANIYSDYITRLVWVATAPNQITLAIEATASQFDESYRLNNGYRSFSSSDVVTIRNVI